MFAQFSPDMWTELVSNFGPLIGVVLFFIWRDWKREDRLNQRVERLEDYQKNILMDLIEKSTTVLAQNTECLKWVGQIVQRMNVNCVALKNAEITNPLEAGDK
jgi:hypothetical protein